jgi:glycosyltransferase involved in cell wall biosynthesis
MSFAKMKYPEQKGLISIIVPIFNQEVYLEECLDSILAQTFKNWEALLVNDGSTDDTGKIIDEYAKKDSRFIAIHKNNEGTLLARKTGLENSRGEFIANIDHDDTYNSGFLEKMYAKITATNADFVWCKSNSTWGVYNATDYEWNQDASVNVSMILTPGKGCLLMTWNKLIKREIYTKVYFPRRNMVWGEDVLQMIQVAYYSKSAVSISESLYFHRPDGNTTTPNPAREVQAIVIIIEDIFENLFKESIPQNVKKSLCVLMNYDNTCRHFFLLDKKQRQKFKNVLQPFLPELIKLEKKLSLKICLFLASKDIIFPFLWRENIINVYKKLKKFAKKYRNFFT